jgi:hypothetical protein
MCTAQHTVQHNVYHALFYRLAVTRELLTLDYIHKVKCAVSQVV